MITINYTSDSNNGTSTKVSIEPQAPSYVGKSIYENKEFVEKLKVLKTEGHLSPFIYNGFLEYQERRQKNESKGA